MIHSEPRPSVLGTLSDDQLGSVAAALAVADLHWTPDVAPAVLDRISRDAVAYPEHFDRRKGGDRAGAPVSADEPASVGRTLVRMTVVAVIILLVAALVVVAATASAGDLFAAAGGFASRVLTETA
jgi:predicted nicotinamide N-methyase